VRPIFFSFSSKSLHRFEFFDSNSVLLYIFFPENCSELTTLGTEKPRALTELLNRYLNGVSTSVLDHADKFYCRKHRFVLPLLQFFRFGLGPALMI